MNFHGQELEDIRDALYSKIESLRENVNTLSGIAASIRNGHRVGPFLPGEEGARAADGMASDTTMRIGRLEAIIGRIDDQGEDQGCEGHESLSGAHMGESVYCNGTCN